MTTPLIPTGASGASTCTIDRAVPAEMIAVLNRYVDERAGDAEKGGVVLSDAKHARADDVRRSDVVWLTPQHEHAPVYDFIAGFVNHANSQVFKFDIQSFTEPFQLATYKAAAKGFYGWHVDIGPGRLAVRKLSVIVPLSDPGDYEGGEFQVFHDNVPTPIAMPLGRIVAFPSYLLHRVTPVTKGARRTLAAWVSGPPFR